MKLTHVHKSIVPLAVVIAGLVTTSARSQDGVPAFQNLRFQEDWSQYPDEGTGDMFDPIKKIELTDDIWMSIGGKLRTRVEAWNNFGFSDANDDTFVMLRAFLHSDIHIGEHWRVFLEGRLSSLTERDLPGGRRDALDADYGDIWNAFVEANYEVGGLDTTVRAGNQELQFGKQRLISPLDWSNNRRIFQGVTAKLRGADKTWSLDAFVTSPVIIDRHKINEHDDDHSFSGLYFTKKLENDKVQGFDAYLLAFNSFNDAMVDHDRYTIGGRVWGGIVENLTYDAEAAYQFGEVGSADISAYMITGDVTYNFQDTGWNPWVAMGGGYASGDDDPTDTDAETFNQLFPLGHAYLGFIDAVGRQNIVDLHCTVGGWPIEKKLRLRADLHKFWLAEDSDALYNAGGGVVRGGTGSESDVGSEIDMTALYKCNRHTNLLVGYSHFFAGDLIEDTGPSDDIDFFYTQIEFTF